MHFGHHTVSRRRFIQGSALVGASAIAVSALSSCSPSTDAKKNNPKVVDAASATYIVGNGTVQGAYSASDAHNGTASLNQTGSWNLPLGFVLYSAEGVLRPYVTPVSGSPSMTAAGVVSTNSGAITALVSSPHAGTNYVVYDARCSDSVFSWCELNLVTKEWKLFAASLSAAGALGSVATLWEADANYDPPSLRCTGSSVIWLVMPATTGSHVSDDSSCYLWNVGDTSADEVVRSPGRFGCAPSISQGMVTLVPRVNTRESGRFYGISAYTLESKLATLSAQLVLPQSVQPLHATYIDSLFAFSIEASYGSGGLLGTMGTYIGNGDDPFIVLPREPAAEVSGHRGIYLMKTRASHLIVDTNAQTYATLVAPNRALDYGDYPASEGDTTVFVTFATVKDADTGYPTSVTMRKFSLT